MKRTNKNDVRIPVELTKSTEELEQAIDGADGVSKTEFEGLCKSYGKAIFEALLQNGTARPVVCPNPACNLEFEVLIRDTHALRFLAERGFGRAQAAKPFAGAADTDAGDPSALSDEQLEEELRALGS